MDSHSICTRCYCDWGGTELVAAMSEREAKLPKWAQDELFVLRQQIETLGAQLRIAKLEASDEASGMVAVEVGLDQIALPDRARVVFNLPGGRVSCMIRDKVFLDLNSYGMIAVLPRASNSAYVAVSNDWTKSP